jgi:arginine utilization protein RocB
MDIENILEIIRPRPSFWLRVWLFFFLLINRKEGKRLIETLIKEAGEASRKSEEMIRKVDAYKDEADRKLNEAQKQVGIGSITGQIDRLFGKAQEAKN